MGPEHLTHDARTGPWPFHIICRCLPVRAQWLAIIMLLWSMGMIAGRVDAAPQVDSPPPAPVVTVAPKGFESGVQDLDIITLILGLSAIPLIVFNWSSLMTIRGIWCWISALIVREVAWISTVLEEFFLPQWFHALGHLCFTASTILLAIGAWIVFHPTASEVPTSPQ